MSVRRTVSEALDVIAEETRSLLARGENGWEQVPIGSPGQILTQTENGPEWQEGGGGGGGTPFSPPQLADFPRWVNQSGTIAEQSDFGPLVMSAEDAASGPSIRARVRDLNATPVKYRVAIRTLLVDVDGQGAGLVLRDPGNGNLLWYAAEAKTSRRPMQVKLQKMQNANNGDSVILGRPITVYAEPWLEIEDDGTQFIFRYGQDGAGFVEFDRMNRTTELNDPQEIGLAHRRQGLDAVPTNSSFFHWAVIPL